MEKLMENWGSVIVPIIFFLFLAMHLLSRYLDLLKKKGSKSDEDLKLREEIRVLLKEANALSGPSTFAQSAKLRRMAAAKETELERIAKVNTKEANGSYNVYFPAPRVLKVLIYVGSIWWFWGVPVAIIAQQQILPFGRVLSWRAGNNVAGHATWPLTHLTMLISDPLLVHVTSSRKHAGKALECRKGLQAVDEYQPHRQKVGAVPWLMLTSRMSSSESVTISFLGCLKIL